MSATELKLRDYQTDAIDAVFQAWYDGMRRPAIVLPTGAGKTVVFSALIKQFRETQNPDPENRDAFRTGSRVMVLVHRDELADQAMAKIHAVAPHLTVGKVKAQTRQTSADVMVCSVQTLARGTALRQIRADETRHGKVGLIITDECHHAAAPSYGKVYDAFPDALQLGVTATMARGDRLGLGDVWEEVVYSRSVLWMMSKGYLSPVRAVQVQLQGLDTSTVKRSGGDFQVGDLGRAMTEAEADKAIPRAYREHADGRPGIVFTPTVATAQAVADEMNAAGITTAVISGETPKEERHRIYDDFRHGRVQVLANCMVLTEGFDAPWAEVAVIARPTQSAPLYIQMVGRVLRTFPGKADALVIDLVGASSNKLRTLVDLDPTVPLKEVKEGETLEEAALREIEDDEAQMPAPPGTVAFDLKHKDVDLFASSSTAWLTTKAGIPFVPAGDVTVFLFKSLTDPSLMDVVTLEKHAPRPVRHPVHQGLDMGTAMAWAEVVAEDVGAFSVAKSARWRKSKPSDGQVGVLDRFGVDSSTMTRGQASDAISVLFASRALDVYAEWA
jgi:superfamily II DNA or RNA helicase